MFTRQLPQKKKSCSCCVRAKRKCDLDLPRCGRCAKQNLNCEYPYAEPAVHDADLALPPPMQPPPQPSMVVPSDPKLGFTFNNAAAQLDFFSADSNAMNLDDDLLLMSCFDPCEPIPVGMEIMADPPSNEVTRLGAPPIPFSTAPLSHWTASRLLFAMDLIKKAPVTMVQENQTPWCHSRLYSDLMPERLSGTLCTNAVLETTLILTCL